MITTIQNEIIAELGDMYDATDSAVLYDILDDVITDALYVSNRQYKSNRNDQLTILKSNIKKATKTIYLQRGTEDVTSETQSGISKTYDIAMETMKQDIIRQNKRLLI
ncbi:MAG: hypothetical protein IJI98_03295 [Methanosphaera sp.]|nr:hypothetical protein [Methanosphaera sp.]